LRVCYDNKLYENVAHHVHDNLIITSHFVIKWQVFITAKQSVADHVHFRDNTTKMFTKVDIALLVGVADIGYL